jgi:hypothetical protein
MLILVLLGTELASANDAAKVAIAIRSAWLGVRRKQELLTWMDSAFVMDIRTLPGARRGWDPASLVLVQVASGA